MKFSTVVLTLAASALCKASADAIPYANADAFAMAMALEHGSTYSTTMGEIAILYPPDRAWSEDYELTAPCGTAAGVTNRTEMSLDDAFVALVAKSYSAWSVSLKISYTNDPTSNADFDEWASGNVTNEISIGHTCFYMPDIPSSVQAGDNATIQLEYMAIEDSANVTHYACADITWVEDSVFKTSEYALSCFNATDNSYYSYSDYAEETETVADSTSTTAAATTTTSASSTTSATTSSAGAAAANVAGISGLLALLAFNFLV